MILVLTVKGRELPLEITVADNPKIRVCNTDSTVMKMNDKKLRILLRALKYSR